MDEEAVPVPVSATPTVVTLTGSITVDQLVLVPGQTLPAGTTINGFTTTEPITAFDEPMPLIPSMIPAASAAPTEPQYVDLSGSESDTE